MNTHDAANTEPVNGAMQLDPWQPVRTSLAWWNWFSRVCEARLTRAGGKEAVDAARGRRLHSLVEYARLHSPFYRDAYRGMQGSHRHLPDDLPVVNKQSLMARFDDWVTDREVKLCDVEKFVADRKHIGERFLDRYIVWKSSGTTGSPGVYIQDSDALATFDALMAVNVDQMRLPARWSWRMLGAGGSALVAATGDHFAAAASWQRVCRGMPGIEARCFSIMDPLPRLVADLNAYQPAFLASYPTMLALLAEEQVAGRLRIHPLQLWSGGECLPHPARVEVERAFGCPVVNEYGASECMSIAFGCPEGWLHVNADWVLLEPVDRDFRPTPVGVASHTVLLTNLANRVQPVIRYDLGDSLIVRPDACGCGSSLPAIQVEGRRDDVVALTAPDGGVVRILPLALTTIVEEATQVHRFQIVQTAADRLMLRFDRTRQDDRRAAWHAAAGALQAYLAQQSLPNVHIGLDKHNPLTDRRSGKLREVIVALSESPGATPHRIRH